MKSPFHDDNGYWKCPWCTATWPPEIPFIMWEEEPFVLFARHISTHYGEIKDEDAFVLALRAYKPARKYWTPGEGVPLGHSDSYAPEKYQSE